MRLGRRVDVGHRATAVIDADRPLISPPERLADSLPARLCRPRTPLSWCAVVTFVVGWRSGVSGICDTVPNEERRLNCCQEYATSCNTGETQAGTILTKVPDFQDQTVERL